MKRLELTGQEFGRWTVLEWSQGYKGDTGWRCRCQCGKEKIVASSALRSGRSTSCGCYRSEATRKRMTGVQNYKTHGMSATPIYQVWTAMKQRCQNPRSAEYFRYGGRGITVCPEWQDFEVFYRDVGDPGPGMSLDRINNDGDYEPGNVRWATRQEQVVNRGGYHCRCCRAGRMFRVEPGSQ